MVAQPYEYTENQWIVHFKGMNCMVCELYVNLTTTKELKDDIGQNCGIYNFHCEAENLNINFQDLQNHAISSY